MAKFIINDDSFRRVIAEIDAATGKKRDQFAQALRLWADDAVGDIQEELRKVGAFDQGILAAATTRTDVIFEGTKLKIIIFNPEEYAFIIEFGRQPGGKMPILPLVGWAGRKGIISSLPRNISMDGPWEKKWQAAFSIWRHIQSGGGKSKAKKKPISDPQIRDMVIVLAIRHKIITKGFKGRHPFANAFDRKTRTFRKDIAGYVRMLSH